MEETRCRARNTEGIFRCEARDGLHRPAAHHIHTRPTSRIPSFWNVIFSVLAAFGSCCLCLCCLSLCSVNADLSASVHRTRQNLTSCGAGYRPLINQPAAEQSAPPPPYYRGDYPPAYNPNYVSASQWPTTNSWWAPTGWPRSSSDGPGFWTGAATGGLLGYLFGNRGTNAGERCVYAAPVERTYAPPVERNFEPASHFASDSSYVSDLMSDIGTSTGFGGTDRR